MAQRGGGGPWQQPRGRGGPASRGGAAHPSTTRPVFAQGRQGAGGDQATRGRGGYRQQDAPRGGRGGFPGGRGGGFSGARGGSPYDQVAIGQGGAVELLSNFMRVEPMKSKSFYSYRFDTEPVIEQRSLHYKAYNETVKRLFKTKPIFDDKHDIKSMEQLKEVNNVIILETNQGFDKTYKVTVKKTGLVTSNFELLRAYNTQANQFLKMLGYYDAGKGLYVHPYDFTPVDEQLKILYGVQASISDHENNTLLLNLKLGHKLMQSRTVYEMIREVLNASQQRQTNVKGNIKSEMVGKKIFTTYTTTRGHYETYKIEDVDFTLSPKSTFQLRDGNDISYIDYFKNKYGIIIKDKNQPLLIVTRTATRRRNEENEDNQSVTMIPELCMIAGQTDRQRENLSLKIKMIKLTQKAPDQQLEGIRRFFANFRKSDAIKKKLEEWSYDYSEQPLSVKGRVINMPQIGFGRDIANPAKWLQPPRDANFMVRGLAVAPKVTKIALIMSQTENASNQMLIETNLKKGFEGVGFVFPWDAVEKILIPNDSVKSYVDCLKQLKPNYYCITIVIIANQNKEKYDAIKKFASIDRGFLTQVITSRLILDPAKSGGASTKIAVQIAAKLGGEPWWISFSKDNTMVCGFDTYHDTTNRGRAYGAFLASMNDKYTQWYSKADSHDRADEWSSQLPKNIKKACDKYKALNKTLPQRVILYRDGVGEGQFEVIEKNEVKMIKEALKSTGAKIKLDVIIVNKRIGARFYQKLPAGSSCVNPLPGTVIDDTVTRDRREDFYLVSQSTRNGTVTPTYYNLLCHENTDLTMKQHQELAYKLTLMYFNWSGSVRVPAPCQYAHKLALLCGDSLHEQPNQRLDDKLHFL